MTGVQTCALPIVKACNSADVCSISVAGTVEVNMPQLTMKEHLNAVLSTVTEKIDEGWLAYIIFIFEIFNLHLFWISFCTYLFIMVKGDLASALTRATSCIQTLHIAGITSGATLQRLIWMTELLIRRQAARIEFP